MTYRSSIGEMFVLGFRGLTVPGWLRDFATRFGLGGVILFDYDVVSRRYGRNVTSPEQVRELCAEVAKLPSAPLVLVDQEGGKVRRFKEALGFAPLPSAQDFNLLPPDEKARLAGAAFAELRALGVSYNLAPVIDLNLNPCNPDIGAVERAYSSDPDEVRANAVLLAEAARRCGLGLCLKHYPGLGGATVNSHDALTDLSPVLHPAQLALFNELAPALPGQAVLVSHGIVNPWEPGVPASVSPVALARLRAEAGAVLAVSDDLQMNGLQLIMDTRQACRRGLRAGLDLLLIGNNLRDESRQLPAIATALAREAEDDSVLGSRIAEALGRLDNRKRRFGSRTA